jgi:hypothetical protein
VDDEQFLCPRRAGYVADEFDTWRTGSERWDSGDWIQWPESFVKPRTCSHCGGVHPDDAIELLTEGWSLEMTDKGYKFYMHPPERHSVVPPVKLYLMHWTHEQVARADEIVRARRQFMTDARDVTQQ